jgi:hypothetical protein
MQKLMSITELAQRASVHPDTIRKWEELGYVSSIRTLGGHRRYLEAEAEHVMHQMKCPDAFDAFGTLANNYWLRKDRFIYWKRFIGFHHYNQKINLEMREKYKREGSEMVIQILETLNDEDWKSIDKIDDTLESFYSWYRKHKEYYNESVLYNSIEGLIDGTYRCIRNGKDCTQEAIDSAEIHYKNVLDRLGMKKSTKEELSAIGDRLDGAKHVLWEVNGIASGGEDSALAGNGSFPNERQQMELDKKNGWDGIGDFSEQRKKLNDEKLLKALQKYHQE